METVAVQKVVESMRHPPALYWGVVSAAAALCWGTSAALAKRGKCREENAVKRVRRWRYAEQLRPFLEDLVYLFMAILNNLVGILYWILDFVFEGRPMPNRNYFPVRNSFSRIVEPELSTVDAKEEVLHKPRRGAIMRLRTRLVRNNSLRGRRQTCGCWGWEVEDLDPDVKLNSDILGDNIENGNPRELNLSSSSGRMEVGVKGKDRYDKSAEEYEGASEEDSEEGEELDSTQRPRWSECHCPQCARLVMPMSLAAGKLYVRCENSPREGQICTDLKYHTGVIFIHGLFSSSTFWFDTDIVPHLSDDMKRQHHIFAPDLLGCGRSPRPVDSLYSLIDQIEAIERSVIKRHNLKSFHLVGHSMGSIVALTLAARCPERVRSISLIAPVYPPGCLREDGQLAQLPCDAFFSFLNPFTLKGVRALTVCKYYNISRLIGHVFYSKHLFWVSVVHSILNWYPRSFINDYLTNYHDAAWHITHNTLLAGTHAVIPALQKLQASGHRILVIHGENDTSIQFRLAEEMSQTFSNVDLVGVPEKGHVDVVWGRAVENAALIEKAVHDGDSQWPGSS